MGKRGGQVILCAPRAIHGLIVGLRQFARVSFGWMCREALHTAGVLPTVRFNQALDENHDEPDNTMPLAAEGTTLPSWCC